MGDDDALQESPASVVVYSSWPAPTTQVRAETRSKQPGRHKSSAGTSRAAAGGRCLSSQWRPASVVVAMRSTGTISTTMLPTSGDENTGG